MKPWKVWTLGVSCAVVALVFWGSWDSRGRSSDYHRQELNQVASIGLGAMCNQYNIREWWELKKDPGSGIESAVVVGAKVWIVSEQVDWRDSRIDGDWLGPIATIEKMDFEESKEEFFRLGDELSDWCSESWSVLFDSETGMMPR